MKGTENYSDSSEITTTTRTIRQIVNGAQCPFPINIIPDKMGINLNSVASVTWSTQEDGQLVTILIQFKPNKYETK